MGQQKIRIGSRQSRLAIRQSQEVIETLQKLSPETIFQLVTRQTTGDRILNRSLEQVGGKGLFLKELDQALLERQVDLCVHSLKDVPAEENPLLPIGAYCKRAPAADVLVLPAGETLWNQSLPVGCAGARRAMQLRQVFPETKTALVRGNVLTRLEKLDRGEYGALLLAEAGLCRLRLEHRIFRRFSPEEMVPAPGQGILAVQSRTGEYEALLALLNDSDSECCARTERYLAALLGGDCAAPVGCYAKLQGETLVLYGFSGVGGIPRSGKIQGNRNDATRLAKALAAELQDKIQKGR